MSRAKREFTNYCHQTSLHGWSYFANESGGLNKVFWLVVLITACTAACLLFASNYLEFIQSTPATNIESTTMPLKNTPFPTLFLCNNNQIQASFLDKVK